jgi:homoserine O-acetyltransferase/O-succinyltransferase
MIFSCRSFALLIGITLSGGFPCVAQQTSTPATTEGDFVAHDFKFRSGESLPELRLHYRTFGNPARDAHGHVTNAVLILHGTGGSGQ